MPTPEPIGSAQYGNQRNLRRVRAPTAVVNQYQQFLGGASGQQASGVPDDPNAAAPTAVSPQPNPTTSPAPGPTPVPPGGNWAQQQLPGQRVNPGSFAETPNIGGSEQARTRIEQAMMNRWRAQNDPMFAEQQRGIEQQLANRGLAPGSEAYETELNRFLDARNRATEQATNQSILAGSQEASRLFQQQHAYDAMASAERIAALNRDAAQGNANAQMELARLQFESGMNAQELEAAFRQQAFDAGQDQQAFENQFRLTQYGDQAALTDRQQFFNELGFFMGPSGYPQLQGGGFGAPNVGQAFGNYQQGQGLQYQGNLANYQQGQQQQQNWLALAGMLLSNSRYKDNIREPDVDLTAELAKVRVKQWRYKGQNEQYYGPLAEDTPEAFSDGNKVNMVNVVFALVKAQQDTAQALQGIERRLEALEHV